MNDRVERLLIDKMFRLSIRLLKIGFSKIFKNKKQTGKCELLSFLFFNLFVQMSDIPIHHRQMEFPTDIGPLLAVDGFVEETQLPSPLNIQISDSDAN